MKRPDSPAATDNSRIDELEARLAQQDHAILELSDEIYRQQRDIAQLERKLREIGDRLKALADPTGSAQGTQDERPPHY